MNQWLDTAEVLDQPLLARYKRSTNSNEMACGSPVVSVNIASWSSAIENSTIPSCLDWAIVLRKSSLNVISTSAFLCFFFPLIFFYCLHCKYYYYQFSTFCFVGNWRRPRNGYLVIRFSSESVKAIQYLNKNYLYIFMILRVRRHFKIYEKASLWFIYSRFDI